MKYVKTYCFYQQGAAEAEIEFWKRENIHRIIKDEERIFNGETIRLIHVDNVIKKGEKEYMVCIPDVIPINAELHTYLDNTIKGSYKKTLYFGKITSQYASVLSNFITAAEKSFE